MDLKPKAMFGIMSGKVSTPATVVWDWSPQATEYAIRSMKENLAFGRRVWGDDPSLTDTHFKTKPSAFKRHQFIIFDSFSDFSLGSANESQLSNIDSDRLIEDRRKVIGVPMTAELLERVDSRFRLDYEWWQVPPTEVRQWLKHWTGDNIEPGLVVAIRDYGDGKAVPHLQRGGVNNKFGGSRK